MRGRFFCAVLLSLPLSAAIPPPVVVRTQIVPSGDRILCRYDVTNHTPQPIVALAIGGNENLAGPYELAVAPFGFDADTGAAQQLYAPEGWDGSLLKEPAGNSFAVEWETKDYSKAIMPERSGTFDLAFEPERPPCRQGHWTAISRDSQVFSGFLGEEKP